jgi:hypothetical protein
MPRCDIWCRFWRPFLHRNELTTGTQRCQFTLVYGMAGYTQADNIATNADALPVVLIFY